MGAWVEVILGARGARDWLKGAGRQSQMPGEGGRQG